MTNSKWIASVFVFSILCLTKHLEASETKDLRSPTSGNNSEESNNNATETKTGWGKFVIWMENTIYSNLHCNPANQTIKNETINNNNSTSNSTIKVSSDGDESEACSDLKTVVVGKITIVVIAIGGGLLLALILPVICLALFWIFGLIFIGKFQFARRFFLFNGN